MSSNPRPSPPARNVSSRWFARFHPPRQPAIRLYCFPYAGASATVYRGWPAAIDPRIDVVALQLPHRAMRLNEPPARSIELLAPQLAEEIERDAGGMRFAFFGHSMGALLVFETLRRLRMRGARLPERVFVSGRQAPQVAPARVRAPNMSDAELVEEMRDLEGTPKEILDNAELLAFLLPTLRSDFALIDGWRFTPGEPFDMPLCALAGDADAHVEVDGAAQWAAWTTAGFELLTYRGGHFFLHEQERQVTADVAARLLK